MVPRGRGIVKIYFRSNPRWRAAPKVKTAESPAVDCPSLLKLGKWVRYGSAEVAELLRS